MPFDVFFEIGGKKLRMRVNGLTEEDAKREILSKVKFHKVQELKGDLGDVMADILKSGENLMNDLNKKQ